MVIIHWNPCTVILCAPVAGCRLNAARECRLKNKPLRIGIYVGAFDPVHAGHVAFALQAIGEAGLDEVIFLPERRPRFRIGPEHYAHRIAMLKAALAPHPRLSVLEVVESRFSFRRTVPNLRVMFPDAVFAFIGGMDMVASLSSWPYADVHLSQSELIVSTPPGQQETEIARLVRSAGVRPRKLRCIQNFAADVASSEIRQALRTGQYTPGLLMSVRRYAKREWLYVSPSYHRIENA